MRTTIKTKIAAFILFMTISASYGFAFKPAPDQPATFGTTETSLKQYLAEKIEYPKSLVNNGYEVKVHVKFWVDKFGVILNAEVAGTEVIVGGESITAVELSLFEMEALEAVSNMPRWSPAIVNGESTPVKYVLPILFKTN